MQGTEHVLRDGCRRATRRAAGIALAALIALAPYGAPARAGAIAPAPRAAVPAAPYAVPAPASPAVLENDALRLELNEADLNMRLTDKRTGYVWSCNAEQGDKGLNDTWKRFGSSGVTISVAVGGLSVQQASFTGPEPARIAALDGGLAAAVAFPAQGVSFTVTYRLDGDALIVGIPRGSIRETNDKYRLQSVTLYPFLGATRGQADGFILVPDGSGALIDLSVPTLATQPYKAQVYGDDLGFYGTSNLQKTGGLPLSRAALPAYGIAYGGSGLLTMITGGAPWASISAYAAGVTMDYNWAATTFAYRDFYYQFTTASQNFSAGVLTDQADPNDFDAELRFTALSGGDAGYAGMARRVRAMLIGEGSLPPAGSAGDSLVRLQMLMAESKQWLLGRSTVTMTRPQDVRAIVEGLSASGVMGAAVELTGWQRGGATWAPPASGGFEGSAGQWESMIAWLKQAGVPLYLYDDFVRVYNGAPGYGKSDVAFTISDRLVSMNDPRDIYRTVSGTRNYAAYYFLNPAATARLMPRGMEAFGKRGVTGVSMDAMGSWLNSAYKNKPYTREEAMQAYASLLGQFSNTDFAFYYPNSYVWKYAGAIYDLPTSGSGLLIETESVPFLPIVLRGSIDYFADPANFWSDPDKAMLKLVEYGALPSYVLTQEDPVQLTGTGSAWIYSSQYAVWRDRILAQYNFLKPALDAVRGAEMTGHTMVAPGVYRTDYAGGVSAVVNYNNAALDYGGRSVPPMGYILLGEVGE